MSYLFDGVDDAIYNNAYTESGISTVVGWIKLNSYGGGGRGRVFIPHQAATPAFIGTTVIVDSVNFSNALAVISGFDSGDGYWGAASVIRTGHWIAFAIMYDRGNMFVPPLIYTMDPDNGDSGLVSRSVVTLVIPAGTPWTIDSYLVGSNDRATDSRVFDGRISYLQRFNSLLSLSDANNAVNSPGSYTTGRTLALNLAANANDTSGNAFHGTVDGATLDGDEPPVSIGGGGGSSKPYYYRHIHS